MNTEQILKACCDDGDLFTKYSLTKPFSAGGYMWATDAKILARAPGNGQPLEAGRAVPDAASVFVPFTGEIVTLDDPGPIPIRCPICGGKGIVRCAKGWEHICSACKWSEGDDLTVRFVAKRIRLAPTQTHICGHYARLLYRFGVREIGVRDDPKVAVCWRVGDVEGVLMPTHEFEYGHNPRVARILALLDTHGA